MVEMGGNVEVVESLCLLSWREGKGQDLERVTGSTSTSQDPSSPQNVFFWTADVYWTGLQNAGQDC